MQILFLQFSIQLNSKCLQEFGINFEIKSRVVSMQLRSSICEWVFHTVTEWVYLTTEWVDRTVTSVSTSHCDYVHHTTVHGDGQRSVDRRVQPGRPDRTDWRCVSWALWREPGTQGKSFSVLYTSLRIIARSEYLHDFLVTPTKSFCAI